jgi:translation initiation factor 1
VADKPFHNPFAVLGTLRGSLPQAEPQPHPPQAEPKPAAANRDPEPPPGVKPIPRAVVRLERSGRGGKEVTAVDVPSLSPMERVAWLKALKTGLGCGGTLESNRLVLQGDQRTRLPALLTSRGVKKITVA